MRTIIIADRSEENTPIHGLIKDEVIHRFGRVNVHTIKQSDNTTPIEEIMHNCAALVLIIGPHWVDTRNENGQLCLASTHDPIRQAIEIALQKNIMLIVLLVDGISLPIEFPPELPPFLFTINDINARIIRYDPDFTRDMRNVLETLQYARARPIYRQFINFQRWFAPHRALKFGEIVVRMLIIAAMVFILISPIGGYYLLTHKSVHGTVASTTSYPYMYHYNGVSAISQSDVWIAGDAGTIMSYNDDHWEQESTTSASTLNVIKMISLTDGWAVGNNGTILHHTGSHYWEYITSPTSDNLYALSVLGPDNIWAAGEHGTILHYQNKMWTQTPSPTSERIHDMQFVSSTEGVAVGDHGTILHWDGTAWSLLASPTSQDLKSISLSTSLRVSTNPANNQTYYVGMIVGNQGTSLFFNGQQWALLTTPTLADLSGVSIGYDGSAFAVGDGGTVLAGFPTTLGYTGTAIGYSWKWDVYPSPTTADLTNISVISQYSGWVVGNTGTILQLGPLGLVQRNNSPSDPLYNIVLTAPNEGWAVGNGIYMLHNGYWTIFPLETSHILSHVIFISPSTGWIVGNYGTIYHFDHGTWTLDESPVTTALASISATAPDNAWVVGEEGTLLHYDGHSWTKQDVNTNVRLVDIQMMSNNDGWIIGGNGTILHYNGQTWDHVASPTNFDLKSIAMTSSTDGWITGNNGVILHYIQGRWQLADSGVAVNLNSIAMRSASDGWIVGDGGVILHYQGNGWQTVTSPTDGDLKSIAITGNTGWISGYDGIFLFFDGNTFTLTSSPQSNELNDVVFTSDGHGWAVGESILYHYDGHSWKFAHAFEGDMLYRLAVLNADDIWIADYFGRLWHFDGTTWQAMTVPVSNVHFLSLVMTDPNNGWITGDAGILLHYQHGQWTLVNTGTTTALTQISLTSPMSGWIVGGQGTLLQMTDGNVVAVAAPTQADLNCVTAIAPNDVWVCGSDATYHLKAGTWTTYKMSLISIIARPDGLIWGLDPNESYQYQGTQWVSQPFPVVITKIHAMALLSGTQAWAVGQNGTILFFSNNIWMHLPIRHDLPTAFTNPV